MARLGAQRALGDGLVVDVEGGGAEGFVVISVALLGEVHAEHVRSDGVLVG
jgi:hypothetical protein